MHDLPFQLTLTSASPDETRRIAGGIAAHLQPGDVIALSGDLGAGKTCFVQGAAAALGVTVPVTSPTFVLVKYYDTDVAPLVHTDVYRLDQLRDVDDLGDEVMSPEAITFIEWGDAVAAILPEHRLEVEVGLHDPGPDAEPGTDPSRTLRVCAAEPWADRWDDLAASVRDWT